MNAAQAGIQAQQFRTNLSEKARQFDISHKLAVTEQNLRERKFTLDLENAELDQQYQEAQIEEAQFLNQERSRVLSERKQFSPYMQQWRTALNQWNGRGEPPAVSPDMPREIYDTLNKERLSAMGVASNNTQLQSYQEGEAYMRMYHPDKIGDVYDLDMHRLSLKLRGQDERNAAAAKNQLEMLKLQFSNMPETSYKKLSSIIQDATGEGDEVNLGKIGVLMREAGFSQQKINDVQYGLDPVGALRLLLLERERAEQAEAQAKQKAAQEEKENTEALGLDIRQTPPTNNTMIKGVSVAEPASSKSDGSNRFDYRGF